MKNNIIKILIILLMTPVVIVIGAILLPLCLLAALFDLKNVRIRTYCGKAKRRRIK